MRLARILMGILFCFLVQQNIHAQTIYTWEDATGRIHISQRKPPSDQPLTDQQRYTARLSPKPEVKAPPPGGLSEDTVLSATRQAKLARKQATDARRMAEDAIQEASQVKKETDAFLEPWRGKKRIRKDMQLQIENRIQKANQIITEAEQRIDAANEAEYKAQAAEKEALRVQEQFFEAYRMIVSN